MRRYGMANFSAMMAKHGGSPTPPAIVVQGYDPYYNWPPRTVTDKAEPLPFSCPGCKVRVKRAPYERGYSVNEVYLCYCMSATFRPDTPRPRSSKHWDQIRLNGTQAEVLHRAQVADDQS